ncbi:MAG TPA: hypothetical protein VNM14_06410 [Planctomycetota bacterium]|jgi:hypothetical protein|nr:hypothetical protein [Planctomycetota bacterium]
MKQRLATAFFVLACAFGSHAKAAPRALCLAEYRSPEYLVGSSPLIVIGAVEEVNDDLEEDKREPVDRTESAKPTLARVKILQTLKGRYDRPELRVGSGPLQTCAPFPVHYHFQVGEKLIFILPDDPRDGTARLRYSRSLLECEKASMIHARLSWARAYRESFLEELRQILPKVHQEALDLAKELRGAAPAWPKGESWLKETAEVTKAKEALLERLAKADVEAIRAALAVDWLDGSAGLWWRSPFWEGTLSEMVSIRGKEVERVERNRLDRELAAAGVKDDLARKYRDAVALHPGRMDLRFPPYPLHPEKNGDRDNLTTEFILRCHTYDRGELFPAYGMGFDVLGGLDPARVSHLIPQLFGSDDDKVHLVAYRAIERIPGTSFVDLVLRRVLQDSWAWLALKHPSDVNETGRRLVALLDLGEKTLGAYGKAALWTNLRKAECFEPICIDRAVVALAAVKAADTKEPLTESLHEYLQGAMADRESPTDRLSAEDYKKWFVSHPPLRKER